MNELWNQLAASASRTLDAAQHQKLHRYLDLLLEANQTMNLTRITDRAEAEVQHVGDALTLLPHIPVGDSFAADVGSGGGSPGIPLAIARPDVQMLLIESTKKKAAFLERAVADLGLANVRVTSDRAEDVGHSGRRQSLDVVTARAVATLDWLVEWCIPLLKVNGKLLAMKGRRAAEELIAAQSAIRALGGAAPISHAVELPGNESRVIIEIAKARKTDLKYPRPATLAKGQALR
jgi:16S rRNA (guanine527-N7)-methyltransferase